MPLFSPFRRAAPGERVVQAGAWLAVAVAVLLSLWPFCFLVATSFGDVTDWWAGRTWPDFRFLANRTQRYGYYLAVKYEYWTWYNWFGAYYVTPLAGNQTLRELPDQPEPAGQWRRLAEDGLACVAGPMPASHVAVTFTGWSYWSGDPITAYGGLSDLAWKRHLHRRFGSIAAVNRAFGTSFTSFTHVKSPGTPGVTGRGAWPRADPWVAAYLDFAQADLEPAWRIPLQMDYLFTGFLKELPEVGKDLAKLNAAFGVSCSRWEDLHLSEVMPPEPGPARMWIRFVREIASPLLLEVTVDEALHAQYVQFLVARHGSAAAVSARYGVPPEAVPLAASGQKLDSAAAWEDWDAWIRTVPPARLRLRTAAAIWRDFLHDRYGTAAAAADAHGRSYASLAAVPWPAPEIDRLDWERHRWRYTAELLFKNYRRAWDWMTESTHGLANSARFAVLFAVMSLLVNLPAGFVASRLRRTGVQVSLVGFLVLAAVPLEAVAVPNFLFLRSLGLLNSVWALVLPTLLNGYHIYLMKGVFDRIPASAFEEAQIAGAGELRMFWHVGLPFARAMTGVLALQSFLWAYANFLWALIACQRRDEWPLPILLYHLYQSGAPGYAVAAALVISLLPALLVLALFQRSLVHGVTLQKL